MPGDPTSTTIDIDLEGGISLVKHSEVVNQARELQASYTLIRGNSL